MKRVILIKYGELTTKKGNRNFFVKTLYQNIRQKLNGYPVTIQKDMARMYLSFEEKDLSSILEVITHIFGIHTFHVAYQVSRDLEEIEAQVLLMMKEKTWSTFKVETKRSDKSFPMTSMELSRHLGGILLKNIPDSKVDVHHPEVILHVEVQAKDVYLYEEVYQGLGGYPVGTQPKALLMLSGGIDSPVSGYLALKRGVPIEAVYFEAIPHTSIEARNKVITLSRKLVQYTSQLKLHIISFTEIQEAIYRTGNPEYTITIMRRMMYRIMDELCRKRKAKAIFNGESIGQVASQTLVSMNVINRVTSLPILRPLACFDKLEIIDIAKKIDTYETSILPFEDCCTVFVPKHPVINPVLEECLVNEKKFDYESMIQKAISTMETIVITDYKDNQFDSFL